MIPTDRTAATLIDRVIQLEMCDKGSVPPLAIKKLKEARAIIRRSRISGNSGGKKNG